MINKELSVHAFKNFIGSLESLDLVKKATARNLKNSSTLLLSVVKDEEMGDVTQLDVGVLAERYAEKKDIEASSSSIDIYRSRMVGAINKFKDFQAKNNTQSNSKHIQEELDKTIPKAEISETVNKKVEVNNKQPSLYSLPVLIRPKSNTVVTIGGIPMDLTKEEAERISSILRVYAQA